MNLLIIIGSSNDTNQSWVKYTIVNGLKKRFMESYILKLWENIIKWIQISIFILLGQE